MTGTIVVRAGGTSLSSARTASRWCTIGGATVRVPQRKATTNDWARWRAVTPPLPPETAQERRERERREQIRVADERARAAEAERTAAVSTRARELLLTHLNDEQRAEYEAHGHFHVTSSAGRRFEIAHGQWHNVHLLDDDGNRHTTYCGYFPGVPLEDNILAQKLLIETNEEAYLTRSNASRAR